jgi:HrpA-like RNA helicase
MYDKEMLKEYEIVNTNLSTVILLLNNIGINLETFLSLKFISAPTIESIVKSVEQFFYLEAMDEKGIITDIGKSMSKFQMDEILARCLIESYSLNCIKEILIIISVLQINELFYDIEKIDKDYSFQ